MYNGDYFKEICYWNILFKEKLVYYFKSRFNLNIILYKISKCKQHTNNTDDI